MSLGGIDLLYGTECMVLMKFLQISPLWWVAALGFVPILATISTFLSLGFFPRGLKQLPCLLCRVVMGFSGWSAGKEPACQYRRYKRCGFDKVRKIPWRRKWKPTPVWEIPWTEEPGGPQRSMGLQKIGYD